jgi:Dodecin
VRLPSDILRYFPAGLDPDQTVRLLRSGRSTDQMTCWCGAQRESREQPGTLDYWITSSARTTGDCGMVMPSGANKTLKNVKGAWVKDQEVTIDNGKVIGYKVIPKVTFVLTE